MGHLKNTDQLHSKNVFTEMIIYDKHDTRSKSHSVHCFGLYLYRVVIIKKIKCKPAF